MSRYKTIMYTLGKLLTNQKPVFNNAVLYMNTGGSMMTYNPLLHLLPKHFELLELQLASVVNLELSVKVHTHHRGTDTHTHTHTHTPTPTHTHAHAHTHTHTTEH